MASASGSHLEARYFPVESDSLNATDIASFRALLVQLPTPVLAYCRSGTRSAKLWAASRGRSA
ncbi:hypothetical protein I6H08_03280 [Burkholderia gladioli]|uniref:Beta-lactamase hydrolase-like protein phosphatase-like domain-containing protein n=1 Tax=Burkholderia gladioli TaxID=28095 RepID=A0A2A7S3F5_BURGA|nr:hypothetical protein CEJ98_14070 [Burkholderia gladioli pv. gladioli]AWY54756.1 hypothetical protein A8H28_27055 [Burkholderia gladioli pv. gladioli]PEH37770.1 hypothetical protein CRM94_25115 [Burkholderia gladioli]QPQ85326.1 hypothetical protein I6H08_03280 [Burkholderia gladioli]